METNTNIEPEPNDAIPEHAFLIIEGVKVQPLLETVINIGRKLENHVVIDDPRISRVHAQLRVIKGQYVLFDLDSKGGTFVNGQRTSQTILYSGDMISLAGVTLVFGLEISREDHRVETSPIGEAGSRAQPTVTMEKSTIDVKADGVESQTQLPNTIDPILQTGGAITTLWSQNRKPHLLVVEDDIDLGNMFKIYFDSTAEVTIVTSAVAGLAQYSSHLFDLVILDVELPGLDAYEFMKSIRAASQKVPVLFLTQKDSPFAAPPGLEIDADDYVRKPFDITEVKTHIMIGLKYRLKYLK